MEWEFGQWSQWIFQPEQDSQQDKNLERGSRTLDSSKGRQEERERVQPRDQDNEMLLATSKKARSFLSVLEMWCSWLLLIQMQNTGGDVN